MCFTWNTIFSVFDLYVINTKIRPLLYTFRLFSSLPHILNKCIWDHQCNQYATRWLNAGNNDQFWFHKHKSSCDSPESVQARSIVLVKIWSLNVNLYISESICCEEQIQEHVNRCMDKRWNDLYAKIVRMVVKERATLLVFLPTPVAALSTLESTILCMSFFIFTFHDEF